MKMFIYETSNSTYILVKLLTYRFYGIFHALINPIMNEITATGMSMFLVSKDGLLFNKSLFVLISLVLSPLLANYYTLLGSNAFRNPLSSSFSTFRLFSILCLD